MAHKDEKNLEKGDGLPKGAAETSPKLSQGNTPPDAMPAQERQTELLQGIYSQLQILNTGIARLNRTVERSDSTAAHFHRKRIKIAVDEMFEFIRTDMASAMFVGGDRMQIKRLALEAVTVEGAHLEMGVFKGDSINFLAERKKDQIFDGFDSFEGLPEAWSSGHTGPNDSTSFDAGFFSTDMPKVRDNVRLHKGWFQETIPAWKASSRENIAFLHIDCDIYSSTVHVLEALADRIVAGTIIAFDELLGYYEWQDGEYKAFKEFVEKYKVEFEYLYYRFDCVVVRVTQIG